MNQFNRLFVLNIDGLIIIYIILNDQINKRVLMVLNYQVLEAVQAA